MEIMQGRVVSAFLGAPGTLIKNNQTELEFAFDGVVGDRHRGLTREAWALTDKQPEGTERRNERQWSAVAQDDLDVVSEKLNLGHTPCGGRCCCELKYSRAYRIFPLASGYNAHFRRRRGAHGGRIQSAV